MQWSFKAATGTALLALTLGACTGGDYGRQARGFEGTAARVWSSLPELAGERREESALALTGGESGLRATAEQIAEPKAGSTEHDPLGIAKLERVLSDVQAPEDPETYYQFMARTYQDVPEAMLFAMAAHLAEDRDMTSRFARQAGEIIEADRARLAALAAAGSEAALGRRAMVDGAVDVLRRVDENGEAMDETITVLNHRIASYRHALVRARLAVPGHAQLMVIVDEIGALEEAVMGLELDASRHGALMQALFAPQMELPGDVPQEMGFGMMMGNPPEADEKSAEELAGKTPLAPQERAEENAPPPAAQPAPSGPRNILPGKTT